MNAANIQNNTMEKKMRIVEMLIDEAEDLFGVYAIGAVGDPAIEKGAILLSKEKEVILAREGERGVFTGPVLIPRKQILRSDDDGPYHIWFGRETVRRASELFLMQGHQQEFTEQHQTPIEGLTMVESWIVLDKDKDKAAALGFDVPEGTWMASVKIDNEDVKEKIRVGEINGFSIEGLFVENVNLHGFESELKEISAIVAQLEADKG
jgi:hypothetical protein